MKNADNIWIADALQDIEMGCIKHGLVDVAETVRLAVLQYSAAMDLQEQNEQRPTTPQLKLVAG